MKSEHGQGPPRQSQTDMESGQTSAGTDDSREAKFWCRMEKQELNVAEVREGVEGLKFEKERNREDRAAWKVFPNSMEEYQSGTEGAGKTELGRHRTQELCLSGSGLSGQFMP